MKIKCLGACFWYNFDNVSSKEHKAICTCGEVEQGVKTDLEKAPNLPGNIPGIS